MDTFASMANRLAIFSLIPVALPRIASPMPLQFVVFFTFLGLAIPLMGNPQFQQEPTTATQFSDNFAGGFGNWTVGTNTIGSTMFGQTPTLVTGASGGVSTYAQFKFDTYNPAAGQSGVSFSGTQLQTNTSFALPTSNGVTTGQGIQFQITARVESTGLVGPAGNSGDVSEPISQGLDAASFTYNYTAGNPGYHGEIDYENLTSQQSPPTIANPTGQTSHSNTFFTTSNGDATLNTSYAGPASSGKENSYYAQTPYAAEDTGSTASPIGIYAWHVYDIDWFPNQIDWYVDGQLVREEASGETSTENPTIYVPNKPMAFYVNFWAPSSTFGDAYFAGLTPSATAAGNQQFGYDVADVAVNTLAALGTPVPESSSMALLAAIAGMLIRWNRPGRLRSL
jgi:hypothetical protein